MFSPETMKISYPQLTPELTDEESHYGLIDKSIPVTSPEPQLLFERKEKKDLEIGWVEQNVENAAKEKSENASTLSELINKSTQSHTDFRNFLIIFSILEVILVFLLLLPVTNKVHNFYTCIAVFVFKLTLIARFCWSGTALDQCKAWMKEKVSNESLQTDKVKDSSNDCKTDFDHGVTDKFAPRTIKFRRGLNGKFGIHHIEMSITRVDLESPARLLGVERGDQIIFVNGIDIETLSHNEITRLFDRVSGEITIVVCYNPDRLIALEEAKSLN